LDDVAVDNNMNKQTTLEDEEALDPIDDIWQANVSGDHEASEASSSKEDNVAHKYKLRRKNLTRPYVAYEPLRNNCDSHKTWKAPRAALFLAARWRGR
jgi:hypothetical protein